MNRWFFSTLIFLSGCSWWQAGINDPEVVTAAVASAARHRELGEASGVPYAGPVLGALAVIFGVLIGGKKALKK